MRKGNADEIKDAKKKPRTKKNLPDSNLGIQNFFHKAETPNGNRVTPEAAIIPSTENGTTEDPFRYIEQPKPKPASIRKPRKPTLKVVEPPPFSPVRATTTDAGFLDRLKIREFVLKCILTVVLC